ncbi:MAG: hypothetical protein ACI909_001497, partial [Planctomycetota bacterium]
LSELETATSFHFSKESNIGRPLYGSGKNTAVRYPDNVPIKTNNVIDSNKTIKNEAKRRPWLTKNI